MSSKPLTNAESLRLYRARKRAGVKVSREQISEIIKAAMAGCHQCAPPRVLRRSAHLIKAMEQREKVLLKRKKSAQRANKQLAQERRASNPTVDITLGAAKPAVVTPLMASVLRVVSDLANRGAILPINADIGELAGGHGRSSAFRALDRLRGAGLIDVEHRGSSRRVTILASGKRTGWGIARPGHSPFIATKPAALTPMMASVLRVVSDLANRGATIPINEDIGELAGGRGRSSVSWAIRRLKEAGLLAIERRSDFRRVIILGSGEKTGWGATRN